MKNQQAVEEKVIVQKPKTKRLYKLSELLYTTLREIRNRQGKLIEILSDASVLNIINDNFGIFPKAEGLVFYE